MENINSENLNCQENKFTINLQAKKFIQYAFHKEFHSYEYAFFEQKDLQKAVDKVEELASDKEKYIFFQGSKFKDYSYELVNAQIVDKNGEFVLGGKIADNKIIWATPGCSLGKYGKRIIYFLERAYENICKDIDYSETGKLQKKFDFFKLFFSDHESTIKVQSLRLKHRTNFLEMIGFLPDGRGFNFLDEQNMFPEEYQSLLEEETWDNEEDKPYFPYG